MDNEMVVTTEQGNEILEATNVPGKSSVVKKAATYVATAVVSAGVAFVGGWKAHKAKADKEFNDRVEKVLAEIAARKAQEEAKDESEEDNKEQEV